VRDLEKLAQNLYISPPTLSQHAALACFEPATIDILEARRDEFRARRDLLVPALRELGFGIPVMPTGGFFVYADTSRSRRQPRVLPRRARARRRGDHAGHRFRHAPCFRARALRLHDRPRQDRGRHRAPRAPPGKDASMRLRRLAAALAALALAGCGADYYFQGASGSST
jgi:hypothetical protein